MDTAFEKQSYMDHALIWSGSIGGEENAECVVPDSLPDLGSIVDADATVSLRSKELGGGRLNVQADIVVKLVYQPEGENTLRNLSVTIGSVLTAPATAEDDCIAHVLLRVRSVEGKVVNSRKAALRVELAGSACCYQKQRLEPAGGIAQCDCRVETLIAEQSACIVSDVREKTFVLTDDLALPTGLDEVECILTQRVAPEIEEVEFAGNKMIFRGRARTFLLLRGESGIYPCHYESAFSQIMELEADSEPSPEITLTLTGAYFDLPDHSGGKIALELHLLAQVVCRGRVEFSYLADAYSNQRALKTVFSDTPLCASQRLFSLRPELGCVAECPREAADIVYAKAVVSSANLTAEGAELSVNLRAVYRCSDGSYGFVSRRVQETVAVEAEEGEVLRIVRVAARSATASVASGGIELHASLELFLQAQRLSTLHHITDIAVEEQPLAEMPSLTLLYSDGEDELWRLAKTHRSTRAAILEANGGRAEGLLLIPKCR